MGNVERIDGTRIRSLIAREGMRPIKELLFPVIAEAPVSIEKSPSDQMPTAKRIVDTLKLIGVDARVLNEHNSHGAYPAVYGEIKADVPNAPTILIGGHYDGQPSVKSKWTVTSPHEPKIVVQGGESRIFGRGTSDDWGQVLTHIVAVKLIRDSGAQLPVTLKFLIEGGEEVGSPNMDRVIAANKELLKCDLVILTDSAPGRMDFPVITTSARGLVGAVVKLDIGTNDLHSGDNLTAGAMEIFARILGLKDLKTMRVEIPGFYDRVQPLSEIERAKLTAMPLDVRLYMDNFGLASVMLPAGLSAQETLWAAPSYEWHTTLGSADKNGEHHGIPMANKITTSAVAYVTMRIVANQEPTEILELFKTEVYRRLAMYTLVDPRQLTIEVESMAHPFRADVSGPYFQAVARGMSGAFGVPDVDFGGCGGTEPIAIYYQTILGVPVVFNAVNSPKDNYHGNDESFSFEKGFQPGVLANALIYQNLADLRR